MWSRNEPIAKLLTSWLVPSFSKHNLCLVVLGHCLLISIMKFHDRLLLQQVNSPNSRDKFQICCTDMYLIIFLVNFMVFGVFLRILWDFADYLNFAAPQLRKISEALSNHANTVSLYF